jgi:aspartyl-tRNA synthetase
LEDGANAASTHATSTHATSTHAKASVLKGPIVKFLPEEKQATLIKDLSLKNNDTLFFIADTPKAVDNLAGQIRTELGVQLNLINKEKFEFCFIVDYPMFGNSEETGAIEFTHNPFPCRRVVLKR